MIHLTDKAKEMMLKIATEENLNPLVRAKIQGGGCAGFSYDLFYEENEKIAEMDEVFEFDGVKVVLDAISYQYLDGCTIDYRSDLLGGGFKFENPNSTGSCGCGNSVSFK